MKNHPKVFSGAVRTHRTWDKALRAHGIKPAPKRFPIQLLMQLRDAMESRSEISKKLCWELEYYFGSLEKAKSALKTDKRIVNGWTKKKIISLIQQRHRLKWQKQGLANVVLRREAPALLSAAERYFGNLTNAMNAAGVDPDLYLVRHPRT